MIIRLDRHLDAHGATLESVKAGLNKYKEVTSIELTGLIVRQDQFKKLEKELEPLRLSSGTPPPVSTPTLYGIDVIISVAYEDLDQLK